MQYRYPDASQSASTQTLFVDRWKDVLPAGRYAGFYTEQTSTYQVKIYRGTDDDDNILITPDAVKVVESSDIVTTLSFDANSSSSSRWDAVVAIHEYSTDNDECTYTVVKGTPGSGVPSVPDNAVRLADVEVVATTGINTITVVSKSALGLENLLLSELSDVTSDIASAIVDCTDNGMTGDWAPSATNPMATKGYVDSAPTTLAVSVSDDKIVVQSGTVRQISGNSLIEYAGTTDLVNDVSFTAGWTSEEQFVIVYVDNSGDVDIEDNSGAGYDSSALAINAIEALENSNLYKCLGIVGITTNAGATITSVDFEQDVRDFMNSRRCLLRDLDWSSYTPEGSAIEAALGGASTPSEDNVFVTVSGLGSMKYMVHGANWRLYNASGNSIVDGTTYDNKPGYLGTAPTLRHEYVSMYVNNTLVTKSPGTVLLTDTGAIGGTAWSSLSAGDWFVIALCEDGTWYLTTAYPSELGTAHNGILHYKTGSDTYYRPFAIGCVLNDSTASDSVLPAMCYNGFVSYGISPFVVEDTLSTTAYKWEAIDLSGATLSANWGILDNTTVECFPFAGGGASDRMPAIKASVFAYYGSSKETSRIVVIGDIGDISSTGGFGTFTTTDDTSPFIIGKHAEEVLPIGAHVVQPTSYNGLTGSANTYSGTRIEVTPSKSGAIFMARTDDIGSVSPASISVNVMTHGFVFDVSQPYWGWVTIA